MEHKPGKTSEHAHHHHLLQNGTIIWVGTSLLILTLLTVYVAGFDLGHWNFVVAMAIATLKGTLVALFFMGLFYDHKENGLIFITSFVFLGIFMALTSVDLFFRGNVYWAMLLGSPPFEVTQSTASKYKDPWIETPELLAHGKDVFSQNCVMCHGPNGEGNGPAGAALVPHPRNFHSAEGWTNPRNLAGVFKTIRDGSPGTGMASYKTFSLDDRWSLAHYVLSLGPRPAEATKADFAKFNIALVNGGAEKKEASIPIEMAMAKMAMAAAPMPSAHAAMSSAMENMDSPGARIYRASCVSCHGNGGQGALLEAHGSGPSNVLHTSPFHSSEALRSEEEFGRLVSRGLPGAMMPSLGNLSSVEMRDLYQYVKALPGN